jgi:hypothetical protein
MGIQKAERVESKEWNMTAENGLGFLDAMSSRAIEKRMSNVLHGLIAFLARIGHAAISLKKVEAAKYALSSISSTGINAAMMESLEELRLAGSWLLTLGATAIVTGNEELRITAVHETQQVFNVMKVEMRQLTLSKAIKIHGKNPSMKVALEEFAQSCGIEASNANGT